MTTAYQSGHDKAAKFKLIGAGSFTTLGVTDQQFSEETALHIIQNGSMGGQTGRIPGFFDAKGTITCDFDGNASPYTTAPGIVSGAAGIYEGYVNDDGGTPTFFSVPVRIAVVHYAIPSTGKVTYSFDWALDALSGTFTFPTA